jgi:hypothetical protein
MKIKRLFSLVLAALLLISLAACTGGQLSQDSPSPSTDATVSPSGEDGLTTPSPEVTDTPSPEVTDTPEAVDWSPIYRSFLEENYEALNAACPGGMSGIALLDLDLDTTPELILFDAGASASMGVQFFDIIDGEVQCISANILEIGSTFGGDYTSQVYVNANFVSDFRLLEKDGEKFFAVNSMNGALDFSYNELVLFSRADDGSNALTLTSSLYKYEEYNADTGDVVSARYQQEGTDISAETYEEQLEAFNSACTDLDYEGYGLFVWELKNYTNDLAGFLSMYDQVAGGYVPLPSE